MRCYRVDLMDFDGKILNAENIESATDDAAIEIARRIFGTRRHYRNVEVWQQWRLVYHDRRLVRPNDQASPQVRGADSARVRASGFNEYFERYAASR